MMLLQLPSCTSQGQNKRGKLKAVSVVTLCNWCFHLIQLKYQFSKDFYTCSSADSYYPWKPYGRPISTHCPIKLRILYGAEKKWIFFFIFSQCVLCCLGCHVTIFDWQDVLHTAVKCTSNPKIWSGSSSSLSLWSFSSWSLFWFIKPTALKYVH